MKHKRAAQKPTLNFRQILRVGFLLLVCAVLLFSFLPPGRYLWSSLSRWAGLEHFTASLADDELHIHVINVGKADAILLESPDAAVLVDCGTKAESETVLRYLAAREITHLDAVWITHGDSDHSGGLSAIAGEIEIGEVRQSPTATPVSYGSPVYTAEAGETYVYGDLQLEVMAPLAQYEEENNNSIVFRLAYGEVSMLFCGDIEEAAEEDLLLTGTDLQADILKVAHHGSNTSTSTEFIRAVDPAWAVISVGEDRNDLPRNAVLKRLSDAGVPFFRTDKNGTVVFSTDGHRIHIITENAES